MSLGDSAPIIIFIQDSGSKAQRAANEGLQPLGANVEAAKSSKRNVRAITPPSSTQDGSSSLSSEDWTRRMREVHALSQEAFRLGEEQREHANTSQRLEQRITQGELVY